LESVIYLLDTDTVVFLARGSKSSRPKAQRDRAKRLAARCRQVQTDGDIVGLSAITVCELEHGARHGGRYEAEMTLVRGLTAPFERYDYDAVISPEFYGQLRHELESKGLSIGAHDMLIAAHALALDATLVSNNSAHFSRISGLKSVNWLAGS
jgi:tRNA(fMet)-specific endonuclease VapC